MGNLVDVLRRLDTSIPNELTPHPDPKIMSAGIGARSIKVKLAKHVRAAKAGTPLRAVPDSYPKVYEPCSDDDAELIGASFGNGDTEIHAHRAVILDIYVNPRERGEPGFYAGDRVRISELDPYGKPTFERDMFGRWYAMNETTISMDCATAAPKKRLLADE